MGGQMDLVQLRTLIDHVFSTRAPASGHEDLPALCDRLGLPQPPPQEGNTKAQRADASLAACPLNSVVFRSSGQDLTTAGTYIEMASRVTEPVLLGLAVLAIRNRVKR
ncbi:hypothetical protein ACFU6I_40355 [Streptomyces sp. NPDC057486]|uniref:hypothetical protein n=1 Tax=Streptomyces sp. NPDC057486 TaxID=3346145 RepID=UPI0036A89B07